MHAVCGIRESTSGWHFFYIQLDGGTQNRHQSLQKFQAKAGSLNKQKISTWQKAPITLIS